MHIPVRVTLVNSWGGRGKEEGRFNIPGGIAFLNSGDLLVMDIRNSRVQRFTSAGVFKGSLTPKIPYTGDKPDDFKNRLHQAEGIAVDGNDRIWIADTIRNHRLVGMDQAGTVTQVLGGDGNSTHGSGTDLGSFLWPHGVAVSRAGDLLVGSDTGNNRLQIFRTGTRPTQGFSPGDRSRFYLMHVVEDLGGNLGKLSTPAEVKVDEGNRILVADYGNHRVVILNERGEVLESFGGSGGAPGRFTHPYGLAVGPGGRIAVGDFGNNRIQVFSREGKVLFHFGREGRGPGRFRGPTGMAFDLDGNLYVADAFNHRIQVFSFDEDARGTAIPVNESGPWERRPDLPAPDIETELTPQALARWMAVEIYNDANVHHVSDSGKAGFWGRGYYDWHPPFCTWSMHPLLREVVWRLESYLTLHEITGEERFRLLAAGALEFLLGEQLPGGGYGWWRSDTPPDRGEFYVSGLVGEAMAAGYRRLGDRRYLAALKRICDWALPRPTHINTNYNSFITHPLALYYSLTGEEKYLEKALRLNLESIPGNLDGNGAMKDGHNRKTVYHYLVLRGLLRLLQVMPRTHEDRFRIEGLARRMMTELLGRQHENGAFISSPFGAEPSRDPFLTLPVLALCFADAELGWKVDRKKIAAAMAYRVRNRSNRDDTGVIRKCLGYLFKTAGDREAFARMFSRQLHRAATELSESGRCQ